MDETRDFTSRITRMPRLFEADRGAEARAALPALEGDLATLVERVGGCSPYLAGLMAKEAAWLPQALDAPERAARDELARLTALPPDGLSDGLRQGKRRIALLVGLADLAGVWPLETVTRLLTDLADVACDAALKAALAVQLKRGKVPGMGEDALGEACGVVVLAMGKMGAHELNYSSDIDLIVLFDESRFDRDDFHTARSAFVRATRAASAMLNDPTGEGYVFRTDLRLRPDPSVTPVCIAMEAALHYYESLGRTWERAAYIKARPAAGDLRAGAKFLADLRPFVWRRQLDFAAIQDAHDMRLRIRAHKGLGGPITLPGHNMKLGRGGIREIEFFTQTRQIIAGGRDRRLRVRGTVEGLGVLAQTGWITDEIRDKLSAHYVFHREVEHRLQMVHDAQTQTLPNTAQGFARVAAMMDQDESALRQELTERLTEVHALTEGFFAPATGDAPKAPSAEFDQDIMARWQGYPALRSERASQIFERLKPDILARLARASKPHEALVAFDGFLAGLPAGVQVFSLFEANPHLIDLLGDIVSSSSRLASYLARNASVLDAVIGGQFFAEWPGTAALEAELAAVLGSESDYEARLDTARRWCKEWHFRIGVHFLRGLIDAELSGQHYAELAEAVLRALWPVVVEEFARKHGAPPGRGAAVLAMGSLGAGRLSPASDLDVIVIYDPADVESSDGRRPLATRTYYARLTQALITAMTAPMAEGRLYEVDMRLRPSGNQGPVATSWASFLGYQQNDAWVWEHLALTRARIVAGPGDLAADIERFREGLISTSRPLDLIRDQVADMRRRIFSAKEPGGPWETKIGPGAMQDIELVAQAGALAQGSLARDVASGLGGARSVGWIDAAGQAQLERSYALCWIIRQSERLLSERGLGDAPIGEGAAAFLLRQTGFEDMQALETGLAQALSDAAKVIQGPFSDAGETTEGADA